MLDPTQIEEAHNLIKPYIKNTPVIESGRLNNLFGAQFYFKVEAFQHTGAFKFRGALHFLLNMKEKGHLPEKVTAFSSGNHAQAVAYASKILGVKARIYIPRFSSKFKIQETKSHGAEVILTETRQEAEKRVLENVEKGFVFIPPYDSDNIILGQGTACYEVLDGGLKPDYIFATCGGGGWLSGTYLAKELLCKEAKIYGAEPKNANDAAISYKNGEIYKFDDTPKTIADGARTLSVSERTFKYLKNLDGFIEVSEEKITKYKNILWEYLKVTVEPTSAVSFAAAIKGLEERIIKKDSKILVMISGGNVDV